jgi:hypothetical protein
MRKSKKTVKDLVKNRERERSAFICQKAMNNMNRFSSQPQASSELGGLESSRDFQAALIGLGCNVDAKSRSDDTAGNDIGSLRTGGSGSLGKNRATWCDPAELLIFFTELSHLRPALNDPEVIKSMLNSLGSGLRRSPLVKCVSCEA